jgi:hypothetical protein
MVKALTGEHNAQNSQNERYSEAPRHRSEN